MSLILITSISLDFVYKGASKGFLVTVEGSGTCSVHTAALPCYSSKLCEMAEADVVLQTTGRRRRSLVRRMTATPCGNVSEKHSVVWIQ